MVLAPWMQADLTHFSILATTSDSHPQRFHLSCYDMHVVVNEEYVRCLRAARSSVASCKRHTDAGVEQCRASSLHAKPVALPATRELHTGTQSALQQITEYEKKCINIHCRPSR